MSQYLDASVLDKQYDDDPESKEVSQAITGERGKILFGRSAETVEAKARWFQSLSVEERIDMLCAFTDMILEVNPDIVKHKDVKPVKGRIRVVKET